MLWGLRRRTEPEARPWPEPVSLTGAPWARPIPGPLSDVLNAVPQPAPQIRRRNRIQIGALYPVPPTELERHARALLEHIQTWSPDLIGKYVPQPDLEKCYREFCAKEGWSPRHWTGIGRELGKLTDRKIRKPRGKRTRFYKISKA